MKTYGNAVSGGTHNQATPDLPRATLTRVTHRPWCVTCKRKHDADQLDDNGQCPRCAKEAVRRAEIAAQQADLEARRAAAQRAQTPERPPTPTPAPRRVRTSRSPQPRRVPGTRTVTVTRTIDHTTKIARLEERRTRLRAQLADVDEQLRTLRTEHGTTVTTQRRPRRNPDQPRATRSDKLDLPAHQIIEAYTAGATLAELAADHDCSAPTIARLLDEHDVDRRTQRIDYTPELLDQIRTLYVDEQLTQAQIAQRLDLTTKVVQTAMDRAQIQARESAAARSARGVGHPIKIQPHQHPRIVERYQAGESAPSIAQAYDVAPASIYHVLNTHGITHRHGHRSTPGRDGSANLKARIAALGVASRQIKEWALAAGLIHEIRRGIPPARLVDAYAAAHPESTEP